MSESVVVHVCICRTSVCVRTCVRTCVCMCVCVRACPRLLYLGSFPSVAVILTAPLQGKTKIFVSDHLNHSLMMNFSTKQK